MRTRKINGETIRAFRELKGLSSAALARLIEVDPSTMSYVEAGTRQLGPSKVKATADALGVSVYAITYPIEVAA